MWANIDFMGSVFDKPEKTKEIVEVPKKDIDSIHLLTKLKSGLVNSKVTESKILLSDLENSWCVYDKEFNKSLLNSCRENLLKLA